MRGNLQQSTLAVLLRHLYAERKSGTLHVSSHGLERRLYFRKGAPIFADAGAGERLPARPQAEAILCSTFSWTAGEFSFQDGEPAIDDKLVLGKPPAELILEGTRSIEDTETLARFLGTSATVFACTQTTELPLFSVKLSPAESAILKFARERERFQASDVARVSGELSVLRALNSLVSLGLLQIVSKIAAAEPVRTQEPAPKQASQKPAPRAPVVESKPRSAPPPPPVPVAPVVATASPVSMPTRPPSYSPPRPEPQPVPIPVVAPEPPVQRAAVAISEVVPEPAPAEAVPELVEALDSVPREVEHLFDKFEAKRVREVPPAPVTTMAPQWVDEIAEPEPPQSVAVTDLPARPSAIPPSPGVPRGKGFWGLVALGVGLFALAVTLVVWLVGGSEKSAEAEAVVSAAPSESISGAEPAEVAVEPDPVDSVAEAPPPSEAELFYQANLAVESRDFEKAKLELQTLLELKPDFTAAQSLLTRVERELAAARAPATKPPSATTSVIVRAPAPKKAEDTKPVAVKPDPALVFDEARIAFQRGDLDGADAKLRDMNALDPAHPGARELRDELAQRRWEQSLPLSYRARHDHRLGGCDGTLTLTARGIGYRSAEHEWLWSFSELASTDRKDERNLGVDTLGKKNFKFQLRDPLSASDWTRFLALGK